MIDQDTDFFEIVDNFAKTAHVQSKCIIESRLDFIPQITIAIPTYKRPDLLREALDSALNQTDYFNYEVIVVDNNPERDCDTEIMLMTYANNERLSYFKNVENLGMEGNWNRCIILSKSNFVVLLHDDDLLLHNFLTETKDKLLKNKNIAVLKPGQFQLKNDKIFNESTLSKNNKLKRLNLWDGINHNVYGAPTGVVLNKEIFMKSGGFNSSFYPISDYVLFANLAMTSNFYFLNKPLSIYRWIENESLNANTLENFIIYNYNFGAFLYSKNIFIKHLSKHILDCRFQNTGKNMKKINDNVNFNNNILDINYKTEFEVRITLKLFSIFISIFKVILNFK